MESFILFSKSAQLLDNINAALLATWVAVKFGINNYHEYCIGNVTKFHEAKLSEITHFQYNKSGAYLSKIFTVIPMLFHVNTILTDF